MSNPLAPARGIVYGVIIGFGLWAVAIFIATWWVG